MGMYDVVWPKVYIAAGVTKTAWVRVGAAWDARSGNGISVQLDTLPVTKDWDGKLMLFPSRGAGGAFTGRTEADVAASVPAPGAADDDIPF